MTPLAVAVLQVVLAVVFLQSGFGKIAHLRTFLEGVRVYDILPRQLATLFGIAVVIGEALLGIAHGTGLYLNAAAPLGILLLASFLIAVGINLRRGRNIPCYCLGQDGGEPISTRSITRLAALIVAEAVLIASLPATGPSHALSVVHSFREGVILAGWVAIVFQISVWLVRLPDLWTLASRLAASSTATSRTRGSREEHA